MKFFKRDVLAENKTKLIEIENGQKGKDICYHATRRPD
jgi:hypothetical protein